MKLFSTYVELKTFGFLIFIAVMFCFIIYYVIMIIISNNRKEELLKKNGFKYLKGLAGGQYVAKEYRHHYKKNDKLITTIDIYKQSYKQLQQWINE